MKNKAMQSLLIAGILPVIAFTVIEEKFGTVAGLIAGMILGVGEIIWEWRKQGRVEPMTWGGNGLLLILGAVSLISQEGIWFKLQPALIEGAMAVALWGSVIAGKPMMALFMDKVLKQQQGISLAEMKERSPKGHVISNALRGLTLRIGLFFALHCGLAVWAALYWSTTAWAILKGVGFTGSMILYMVAESFLLRYRLASTR